VPSADSAGAAKRQRRASTSSGGGGGFGRGSSSGGGFGRGSSSGGGFGRGSSSGGGFGGSSSGGGFGDNGGSGLDEAAGEEEEEDDGVDAFSRGSGAGGPHARSGAGSHHTRSGAGGPHARSGGGGFGGSGGGGGFGGSSSGGGFGGSSSGGGFGGSSSSGFGGNGGSGLGEGAEEEEEDGDAESKRPGRSGSRPVKAKLDRIEAAATAADPPGSPVISISSDSADDTAGEAAFGVSAMADGAAPGAASRGSFSNASKGAAVNVAQPPNGRSRIAAEGPAPRSSHAAGDPPRQTGPKRTRKRRGGIPGAALYEMHIETAHQARVRGQEAWGVPVAASTAVGSQGRTNSSDAVNVTK